MKDSIEEKERRGVLKGYLTLEAAMVFPMVFALVIMLFFYHWRNKELMINFSAFIRENLILKDELTKLHNENAALNEELKSYNNK